ncbi:hypothetical protein EVAR_96163_1 [Eumeta japonica]|uniref:Uncharacterized protein n=1 Tax=Eumeta variegata TaxID=151549 RepID=A0A4C1VJ48_EUMVA|nr:hypothetical protein EVAR_96163_1 [Eumeta japonica]
MLRAEAVSAVKHCNSKPPSPYSDIGHPLLWGVINAKKKFLYCKQDEEQNRKSRPGEDGIENGTMVLIRTKSVFGIGIRNGAEGSRRALISRHASKQRRPRRRSARDRAHGLCTQFAVFLESRTKKMKNLKRDYDLYYNLDFMCDPYSTTNPYPDLISIFKASPFLPNCEESQKKGYLFSYRIVLTGFGRGRKQITRQKRGNNDATHHLTCYARHVAVHRHRSPPRGERPAPAPAPSRETRHLPDANKYLLHVKPKEDADRPIGRARSGN